jgi:hypothetical protein
MWNPQLEQERSAIPFQENHLMPLHSAWEWEEYRELNCDWNGTKTITLRIRRLFSLIFLFMKNVSENSSFYWEIQRKTSTNLSASTRIYRSYLTHPFLFLEYLQLHMQRMNDSNLCSPKLQLKNQEVVLFLHLIC